MSFHLREGSKDVVVVVAFIHTTFFMEFFDGQARTAGMKELPRQGFVSARMRGR